MASSSSVTKTKISCSQVIEIEANEEALTKRFPNTIETFTNFFFSHKKEVERVVFNLDNRVKLKKPFILIKYFQYIDTETEKLKDYKLGKFNSGESYEFYDMDKEPEEITFFKFFGHIVAGMKGHTNQIICVGKMSFGFIDLSKERLVKIIKGAASGELDLAIDLIKK